MENMRWDSDKVYLGVAGLLPGCTPYKESLLGLGSRSGVLSHVVLMLDTIQNRVHLGERG